ncbi:MAG: DUF4304 domain-containing protein [Coriobacteriia bacterium]|nr:DUF4304 domain-containing protein [Coriobacteriia bacterium]
MLGVCVPKKGGNKPYGHIQKHLEEVFALKSQYLIIDQMPPEVTVKVVNYVSTKELLITTDEENTAEDLALFAEQLAQAFKTETYLRDSDDFDAGLENTIYRFRFSSEAVNVLGKDFVLDEWNKQFVEAFEHLGFKRRKKSFFIRVVNDQLFQIVELQKSSYPGSYTINYGSISTTDQSFLAADGEVYPSQRLGGLLKNEGLDFWWDYTKNNYQQVMQDTIDKIAEFLMPLFDREAAACKESPTVEQWLEAPENSMRSTVAYSLDIIHRKYMKCRISF